MRRAVLVGLAAAFCFLAGGTQRAAARELITSIDLDYVYVQANVGGDVEATTTFNQKYEIKYETALTTAHDFMGAVRLDLQDSWYTDQAATSQLSPTLELQVKGAQLAAKLAYETVINSTDAYLETAEATTFSSNLSFDLELTPALWPEVNLKLQRQRDFQEFSKDGTTSTFAFSARKDIYALRLEYNFKREEVDNSMPEHSGGTQTEWSAMAAYKEVLWGGTEFELTYGIEEVYGDQDTRGIFTGETTTYTQNLKTRVKNTLEIAPRLRLGLSWEYDFEQDLLELEFDYKLLNKYQLDLRWDAYDWLRFASELRRETTLNAAVEGEEDERQLVDSLKAGFDFAAISWMRVSGKAEFKSEGKVAAGNGGSVDNVDAEKYELIAKNTWGNFWDFTWNMTTAITHTDNWLSDRETKMKGDLKLKLFDGLAVSPMYEVSRTNDWERGIEAPASQKQVRDAKIKFDYKFQLAEMLKVAFSHEYGVKVDDTLDEVLNFERVVQFNENTRLSIVLAEIVRNLIVEGEVDRKASDTEGDPDPQLVELAYSLKLDWKFDYLILLSTFKYNDKGDTFDDVSFNTKVGWKYEGLELTAEYQFDRIIKEITEPKDEKRKLNLKLNYKF